MSAIFVWAVLCAGAYSSLVEAGQVGASEGATQTPPDQSPATQAKVATAPTEPAAKSHAGAEEPLPLFDMHKQMRGLLRDEATLQKEREQWEASVVKLVELYGQITRDERLPSSNTLEKYRVTLRSRLLAVQQRLEREMRRKGIEPPASDAGQESSLADQSSGNQGSGSNAAGIAGSGTARGGAAVDDGWLLVDLIQRTIAPEFWDVNGGPGSIVYYRNWHALVVRATPAIHSRVGAVAGAGGK